MLNRLSIKSKLMIMLLGVSLGSIVVVGYLSWDRARSTLEETILNQLTSVRASKAAQIESYFQNLRNHVETLCEDRMIVAAMVELNKGFKKLDRQYIPSEWDSAIAAYYNEEFFPRLSPNISGEPTFGTYSPKSQAARYLQYHYIANNSAPLGEKDRLADAKDGSEYSKFHLKYHKIFRNLIDKFGYYDFFLINYRTGDIVYSVYKETDFGTNLDTGPYRQSNLAKVVAAVRENPERGAIALVDFQPYRPSYMAPAAFIAGPIYNGPHVVGILAVQLPVDRINNVLTGKQNWKRDGLGDTGETYLVGSDLLMRSISRFLIENPTEYKETLRQSGTPDRTLKFIDQLNTSILLQKMETKAVLEALRGKAGTEIVEDYRGIPVLSSYAPLNIEGVTWAMIAELDVAEAYQAIQTLERQILISTVILILVITLIASLVAYNFTKPINAMIESSRKVSEGQLDIEVQLDSDDEFGELARSFNKMVWGLRQQTELIEQKTRENEALLLNILPSTVAARMKQGEENIADHIQQVTVLFASAIGFTELAAGQEVHKTAEMLNELVNSFDEAADKHDVEKLKTLGETYIAICGLTRIHLDHSKRMVDCALEMLEVLENFNNRYRTNLSLRIGIHAGAVMAGIVGTKKFTYNLWGETVNIASYLNTQAEPNSIMVTQQVYEHLQDLYVFEQGEALFFERKLKLDTWVLRKDPVKI